jgi:uncharacterized protein Yka (UPF0111/DUF47 family)
MEEIIEMKESNGDLNNIEKFKDYMRKLVEEITKICEETLAFIEQHLIPFANT